MKVKSAQVLQIIATVLYLLAFIACVLSIFFQYEIKQLFSASPDLLNVRSVPYVSLVTSLVLLFFAVIYLILVLSVKSRGGSIASVIVMAIFTIAALIGTQTVGDLFIRYMVGNEGIAQLSSYSTLEMAVKYGSAVLIIPATALMFLSMGGFAGKPRKEKKEEAAIPAQQPARPAAPEAPKAPQAPVIPEAPKAPQAPAAPEVPEAPQAPVIPEVPETPVIPEAPEAPVIPEAAEAPVQEVKETAEAAAEAVNTEV